MSWVAKNQGEWNTSNIFSYTINKYQTEHEKELLRANEAIELDDKVFKFTSPNEQVVFTLTWDSEKQEIDGHMIITNLETKETKTYTGDEELSNPEPAKYGFYIFQKVVEICMGERCIGSTSGVEDDSATWLNDEELDRIDKELGFKSDFQKKIPIREFDIELQYNGTLLAVMFDPNIGEYLQTKTIKGCGTDDWVRMLYYSYPMFDETTENLRDLYVSPGDLLNDKKLNRVPFGPNDNLIKGMLYKAIHFALNRYRLVNFLVANFDENAENIKNVLSNICKHESPKSDFGPLYTEEQVDEIFNDIKELVTTGNIDQARDYLAFKLRNYYDINDGHSMCDLSRRDEEDYLWQYVKTNIKKKILFKELGTTDWDMSSE